MQIPVLKNEAIQALQIQKGKWYLDATLGHGGHSGEILKLGGRVLALDFDQEAIEVAKENLSQYLTEGKIIIIRENFVKLAEIRLQNKSINQISGALFDCGANINQLKSQKRGFSFSFDSYLDMRMDQRLTVKAADLLAMGSKRELTHLFEKFGGEKKASLIAGEIINQRKVNRPIKTTTQLVDLIIRIKGNKERIHPATKVMQALRIAINSELENLKSGLQLAFDWLKDGGRLVTLTFHDGEDQIVNNFFKEKISLKQAILITEKSIQPSKSEIKKNYCSRSGLLKIVEKI